MFHSVVDTAVPGSDNLMESADSSEMVSISSDVDISELAHDPSDVAAEQLPGTQVLLSQLDHSAQVMWDTLELATEELEPTTELNTDDLPADTNDLAQEPELSPHEDADMPTSLLVACCAVLFKQSAMSIDDDLVIKVATLRNASEHFADELRKFARRLEVTDLVQSGALQPSTADHSKLKLDLQASTGVVRAMLARADELGFPVDFDEPKFKSQGLAAMNCRSTTGTTFDDQTVAVAVDGTWHNRTTINNRGNSLFCQATITSPSGLVIAAEQVTRLPWSAPVLADLYGSSQFDGSAGAMEINGARRGLKHLRDFGIKPTVLIKDGDSDMAKEARGMGMATVNCFDHLVRRTYADVVAPTPLCNCPRITNKNGEPGVRKRHTLATSNTAVAIQSRVRQVVQTVCSDPGLSPTVAVWIPEIARNLSMHLLHLQGVHSQAMEVTATTVPSA